MAERLSEAGGATILNDVVLNQVLCRCPRPERTQEIIARIQADGTCWLGGTQWQGQPALRISISSWRTTEEDIDRSAEAILRCMK